MNKCQVHEKHDRIEVDTALGKMIVFDWKKYAGQAGIYCTGQSALSETLDKSDHWEHRLYPRVREILRTGDKDRIVLDAGANVGWYSRMAVLAGYDVIAFEGDREMAEVCRLNVPEADVRTIWFEKGMRKFQSDKPIEFLKLDLEGAEEHAISYFRNILFQTKNILIEVSPVFNDSYPRLLEYLRKFGFKAYEIAGTPFDYKYDFEQKDLWLKR